MKLKQCSTVACSEDDYNTSFNGRVTATNTTVGNTPQRYIPKASGRVLLRTPWGPAPYMQSPVWLHLLPILFGTLCRVVTPLKGGWCKGTTHFRPTPSPTPILQTQLRPWLRNSDSRNATPITFTDPSPRHSPLCLPWYCTVPSHAHLAYLVVIPSRVFLRVFSLDFPLLDWVITLALQGCPYTNLLPIFMFVVTFVAMAYLSKYFKC